MEIVLVIAADAAAARRTPGAGPQDPETAGLTAAQEARMRAALVVPREPLGGKQRKIKRGTTGFMLALPPHSRYRTGDREAEERRHAKKEDIIHARPQRVHVVDSPGARSEVGGRAAIERAGQREYAHGRTSDASRTVACDNKMAAVETSAAGKQHSEESACKCARVFCFETRPSAGESTLDPIHMENAAKRALCSSPAPGLAFQTPGFRVYDPRGSI